MAERDVGDSGGAFDDGRTHTGAALSSLGGTTGTALSAMASPGGLGREAERVLGRGLQRVAYRYRGTEHTADRNVSQDVKNARNIAGALSTGKKDVR